MKIELLYFDDCPNHVGAQEMLEQTLIKHQVGDPIIRIDVSSLEIGESVKFPGSPTIRIDGVDVDPTYEDTGDYTPRCRVYFTDVGLKGPPKAERIDSVVRAALVKRS